ncbi:MAG: M1 family metallopeptidase [Gemmatimonadetes bacterium]|nr:M1 family metallopeptidase [Gemmatimonadota bacterium]
MAADRSSAPAGSPRSHLDEAATAALLREVARGSWQQGVTYRIEARLEESAAALQGRARLRYTNASPDTLTDFYLHLYLNAFRAHSLWARRELELGVRRFQDLGPDDHAYERLGTVTFDGVAVPPRYPYAPDSTVAAFRLPRPLAPGEALVVNLDWRARLSTLPRRQGRRGRHYDFAHWFPKVAVYDRFGWQPHPLYPQGEFYGEFATFDVTLELADDQVVGATGVPVSGDPGWERGAAARVAGIEHQREWYGAGGGPPCVEREGRRICGVWPARTLRPEEPLGLLREARPSGTKRVRWYAEDVHDFGWSVDPAYVYEEGRFEDVVIRVLYRPGGEPEWGGGIAVQRTATALAWLDTIFGDYPYPQVTNLHRLEGGGTEFPMLVMNGSASQSVILHEVGHLYVYGILANNEWRDAWLDEGFTSFQSAWFFEEHGGGRGWWLGSEATVLLMDLAGVSQPVSLPSEEYAEPAVYNGMVYTKGALVLRMLRDLVGRDAFVRFLRIYYERFRLRHVDEDVFRRTAEEVLRLDLDWFFGQWLHGIGLLDYAMGDVSLSPGPEGGWSVGFEVRRLGELVMPVPVRVWAGGEPVDTVVPGRARSERVVVRTRERPQRIELDPDGRVLDWNALNNRWQPRLFRLFRSAPRTGGWASPLRPLPAYRDRLAVGYFPLVWANDAGGLVLGLERRTSYMGTVARSTIRVGAPALRVGVLGLDAGQGDFGSAHVTIENPILLGRPRPDLRAEGLVGEGRVWARVSGETDFSRPPQSRLRRRGRLFASVAHVYDPDFLRVLRWEPVRATTVEAGAVWQEERTRAGGGVVLDLGLAAGASTRGVVYARGSGSVGAERRSGSGAWLGGRLFAGVAGGFRPDHAGAGGGGGPRDPAVPRERLFYLAGAGPYELVGNPWMRSAGSLFVDGTPWVHVPGDGNLRGFDPVLAADALVAGSLEMGVPLVVTGGMKLGPTAFADAGWAGLAAACRAAEDGASWRGAGSVPATRGPGAATQAAPCPLPARDTRVLADAGLGLRATLSGSLTLDLRFPFWSSDPALAVQGRHGAWATRALVSVGGSR